MKIIFTIFMIVVPFFIFSEKITTIYNNTLTIGNGMSMTIQLKESDGPVNIPLHTHPAPGTVYLIDGNVQVNIEGKLKKFTSGDVWIEPALKKHSGKSEGPIKYFVVYHHPNDQSYIN